MSFPENASTANPVFFRTYSRRTETGRESWQQVCERTIQGLSKLGSLTADETELVYRMQYQLKTLTSGRWLWVGGTDWIEKPENFPGAYNCTGTNFDEWSCFGLMMNLAMIGSGTGANLEAKYIEKLPAIRNSLNVGALGKFGLIPKEKRQQQTTVEFLARDFVEIIVGDSRQGWVNSYQELLNLAINERLPRKIDVVVDISNVRQAGEKLSGFGGTANPIKLKEMYSRCAKILNKAVGRQLNSVEVCLLIDEAALAVVAGNIRRSAGIKQSDSHDQLFATAKEGMWQCDDVGNWKIDPDKDALRMSNHTRVYHQKPTLEETIEAVSRQYYTGEGAIQWAGEAIARANIDLLGVGEIKKEFLTEYEKGNGGQWFKIQYPEMPETELEHRLGRYDLNPCGK
jgi:ribonucleotide reductase class II